MNERSNENILDNMLPTIKGIESIYELNDIINKLNTLTSDKESRMINSDEIEILRSRLSKGIMVQNNEIIESIINYISMFLSNYGIDEEPFRKMLHNTSFAITNLNVAFNSPVGLALSSGKRVFYDASIISFNEDGKFTGFKKEDEEFLIHVTMHELFHRISAYRDDKESVFVNDTALSEGFTELFASMVSCYNGERKSIRYNFSKEVCGLFALLNGVGTSLKDYIDDVGVYPKLRSLFEKYGLDYKEFEKQFDYALSKRYENANEDECLMIENGIIDMIKNGLLLPYIKDNPKRSDEIITAFSTAFMDRSIFFNDEEEKQNKITI